MVKSSGMEADKIREYYMSNEQMKKNMMYAIKEEKTFAALKADLKLSKIKVKHYFKKAPLLRGFFIPYFWI